MLEKDQIKINEELIILAEKLILADFTDSAARPVYKVESLQILKLEFDNENQNRYKLIVKSFIVNTRLLVQWKDGSTSTHNTQFVNTKPVIFEINKDTDEVELLESDNKLIEQRLF